MKKNITKMLLKIIDNNRNTIMTKKERISFVDKVEATFKKNIQQTFYYNDIKKLEKSSNTKLKSKEYDTYSSFYSSVVAHKKDPVELKLLNNHAENDFDDYVDNNIEKLIKKYNSSFYLNDETIPLLEKTINKAMSIGFKEMAESPNNINLIDMIDKTFNYDTNFSIEEKREASLNIKSMLSQKYRMYVRYLSFKYQEEKMTYIVENMEEIIKNTSISYKQAQYATSINHKDKEKYYNDFVENFYTLFSFNFIAYKFKGNDKLGGYSILSFTNALSTKEQIQKDKTMLINMITSLNTVKETYFNYYKEIDIYDFYTNLTVETLNEFYYDKESIKERVFTTKDSLIDKAIESDSMKDLIATLMDEDDNNIYQDTFQQANITDNTIRELLKLPEITNSYNTIEEHKEWNKSFYVYAEPVSYKIDTDSVVIYFDDEGGLEFLDKPTKEEEAIINEERMLNNEPIFENELDIAKEEMNRFKKEIIQNEKEKLNTEEYNKQLKLKEEFSLTDLDKTTLTNIYNSLLIMNSDNILDTASEMKKNNLNITSNVKAVIYEEAEKVLTNLTYIHDYSYKEVNKLRDIEEVILDKDFNCLKDMLKELKNSRIKHIEEELEDNKTYLLELENKEGLDTSNEVIEKLQHNIVYLEDIKSRLMLDKNISIEEIIQLFTVSDENFKKTYINKIAENSSLYNTYEELSNGALYTDLYYNEEKIYLRYLIVRSKKLKIEILATKEYFENIYGKNNR